ncbi:polyprenyl synthetase family protein [Parvularcula maris]|uniref:Polyprenyl synthetase family protein n=1 Tax=Parvularcula maris TaxID=2965077 RepID=A0A9X2L8M5_9PROT|nr:polyprenyl synthetase family protein [Parvularcula maris]MCQ8184993.1 polyprenyl synthetase family protein [Parvularcula maris]
MALPDLESLRELVNVRLDQLVPMGAQGGPAAAARYSLLAGGKRLRAIITLTAARTHGGKLETALDAACAIEMIHCASLIFDDLPAMDDAALRRGVATVHAKFGQDIAILAGIGLMNGAYEVLAKAQHTTEAQRLDMLRIVTRAVGWQGLVHGQALDLNSGESDAQIDAIHEGKTGALFIAAAECGGVAAPSVSEKDRRALRSYGRALGFAYQAFDDVLDQVVCDEAAGKTTGKDGGKSTAALGGEACIQSGTALANKHFDQAVKAVGKTAPLASLAEFIRRYFAATVAAA